ncbi:MAG: PA14 domain-containing protein [Agriterribacter sp.]
MKPFVLRLFIAFLPLGLMLGIVNSANAQVFDPNDVNVVYNPQSPPTQPVSGPGKWVKTTRMSWNTSSFKCYIYRGIAFRLKYPKTYVPGNGKKYPLFLFFHGAGERGTIYDNDYQLYLGAFLHGAAVDNGQYDGFLLYPQCTNTVFSAAERAIIMELIDQYLIPQVQVDPFRISVGGLSGGGASTWSIYANYPKFVASIAPISNSEYSYSPYIKINKFTPIWLFQGALDQEPPAYRTHTVRDSALANGANFSYTEYPTAGHDCWYLAWNEPNYLPYLAKAHKANPWPVFGRFEFCPQETINQVIGVGAGFDGYEWRKNDTLIVGATTNTITATALGKYDCRIKRGTEWSPWSPIPVVLKSKTTTISPDPALAIFASKVLPSTDGNTTVQLKVADGYAAYKWTQVGSSTVLGTASTYTAAPGSYIVTVTENFGCQSTPSNAFTVVNANGPNKPDAVRGLIVSKLTKTSLKLNWITNAGSLNPATNFEIYQATKSGGPYQFVGITGADDRTFTKVELTPGVKYYYVVRAVNNTAAAPVSAEGSATTDIDTQPPTAPIDLKVTGTTRSSIAIQWTASTDDVGVAKYDIYINGAKAYTTTSTNYIIYNLDYNNLYNITVKARDFTDNESPFSNQVSARTLAKGLTYKYFIGDWSVLPDFNAVTVQSTGFVPNVTLAPRTQNEKFAFLWEGYIRIPVGGSYTFRTNSDDGSRLYFNMPYNYSAVPTVDNDGLHGTQDRDGATVTLTAGVYPIAISYFQQGSGYSMVASWKTPQSNGGFVTIPDSVFVEASSAPVNLPAAPSALAANPVSYKRVDLNWTDNSNNETAFELSRSTDPISNFSTVAVLPANTVTFKDTTVAAATKYYYRVRAINSNGESAYDRSGRGVDYAYYETNSLSVLPDFSTLTPVQTGHTSNFSLGMQLRSDNFAMKYDGTITVPVTGNYKFFTSSDDGSKLYLNNVLTVNNDGAHGNIEAASAEVALTAGVPVPISVTFFEAAGNEALTVSYQKTSGSGAAVAKQIIPATVLGQEYVNITTPAAPPAPAAPTALQVISTTATTVKIAWTNNALGIIRFDVYRSYGNNQDYVLYASTPAANTFYTDTSLFANSTVYYKVQAVSADGISDFSNEISAVTLGVVPTIDAIENQYMRYGTQAKVYVNASTTTSETLTLQVTNLPSFGTFTSTGNGKGVITFNPAIGNQGTYNAIKVTVSNPQNNSASRSFNLVVNDDYVPSITGQTSIAIDENKTQQVTFNATDNDAADVLTWSFLGLPNFVTVSSNNRSAQLNLAPLSGSAGTYNVIAMAEDGRNGKDTMAFTITVSPVAVRTVYVNLSPSTAYAAGGSWNSVNKVLGSNEIYPASANPGFKDQNGVATNIRFSFNYESGLTTLASYSGMNTNVNSGIYPDKVLQAGYKFGWNKSYVISVTGLDVTKKYSFTFLGSFNSTSNGDVSTQYNIGSSTVTLNALRNTQNTISITNVTPDASGAVSVNIARAATNGTGFYYINAIVVSDGVSANAPPGKVGDFQLKSENGFAKLTWTNTTSVVTTNEVYRANTLSGPYTLLNANANNGTAQSYIDSTVQGNKTYFYFVRAKNTFGGANTAVLKVLIPNRAPVLTTSEAYIKTGQTVDVNVLATDDPGDVITLSASNLPSFATFTDNGGGTGKIHLTPAAGNIGVFNATITATDNYGESSSGTIKIYISDNSVTSMYVNFNQTIPVAGIWNSFNKLPAANASISGLKNDVGAVTTAGVTLVTAWPTAGTNGTISGNNTGAYRDDVLQTNYSETAATTKTVRITGLSTDANVRYNLVFMSSVVATDDRTTVFSVGAKTVSINAANNTQNTVQINDITATGGVIEYTVTKGASAVGFYMNALVIQSYTTSTTLLAPNNFKGMGIAKDSIRLVWNNRVNGGNVEIYRSTSANGTFNLVGTVTGATFTDSLLQTNTEYFYKLKAVSTPNVSPFSNTISASTYAYSVYINFNRDNPAALPWNNTNTDPVAGAVYNNFLNDQNAYSGIMMTVGTGFSSTNSSGENTGNNSGVVPDNVMRSTWWADIGQTGQLKFGGLAQNTAYSFKFFASRTAADTRVVNYIINGRVVKLKVNNNRYQTVTMDNVYADQNGEVLLSLQGENITTMFAYIGGLVISGAKKPSDPIDGASGAVFRGSNVSTGTASTATDLTAFSSSSMNVYPNPFRDDIMVKMNLANNVSKLVIKVTDASGRTVMTKEFANVPKGSWLQSCGLNNQKLTPGVYFIQAQGLNGETITPIRILKTK